MLETLKRRHKLAVSDVPVRVRWDRIASAALFLVSCAITGGIFYWMLYLLSEL